MYHYRSRRSDPAALKEHTEEICQTRVRHGYRRVHVQLRREGWTMDFVHNQLATGSKLRAPTVVGTFSRFSPVVDPRFSYRSEEVAATLERVRAAVGFPKAIRADQGSEFISRDLDLWTCRH